MDMNTLQQAAQQIKLIGSVPCYLQVYMDLYLANGKNAVAQMELKLSAGEDPKTIRCKTSLPLMAAILWADHLGTQIDHYAYITKEAWLAHLSKRPEEPDVTLVMEKGGRIIVRNNRTANISAILDGTSVQPVSNT